mmetsp:Transcript_65/g.76  ORF Transcript_65/g.76 Transcript_65/m.76 type:complete len:84 (+) Transcript_65:158-409(+)
MKLIATIFMITSSTLEEAKIKRNVARIQAPPWIRRKKEEKKNRRLLICSTFSDCLIQQNISPAVIKSRIGASPISVYANIVMN